MIIIWLRCHYYLCFFHLRNIAVAQKRISHSVCVWVFFSIWIIQVFFRFWCNKLVWVRRPNHTNIHTLYTTTTTTKVQLVFIWWLLLLLCYCYFVQGMYLQEKKLCIISRCILWTFYIIGEIFFSIEQTNERKNKCSFWLIIMKIKPQGYTQRESKNRESFGSLSLSLYFLVVRFLSLFFFLSLLNVFTWLF